VIDTGGILTVADRMPIGDLPAGYQRPMRQYLRDGVLPEGELREVLEGAFRGSGSLDVCLAHRWVQAHLPACAHGNRDQVQLWCVYVRRARGRAMLAAMDAEMDGAA
jgi:hypothetical protein